MGPAVGSTKHASSVKSAAAAAASPLTIASSNFFTKATYCSRSRLFIVSSVGLRGKRMALYGTGFVPQVSAARIFSIEEYVRGIHFMLVRLASFRGSRKSNSDTEPTKTISSSSGVGSKKSRGIGLLRRQILSFQFPFPEVGLDSRESISKCCREEVNRSKMLISADQGCD